MKAIILAAGRGKRMESLTKNKPKCLLNIKDKLLIDWQIEAIKNCGINDIAIVTGYKNEMLSNYNFKKFYNKYWESSQMVYSLFCASDWLGKDDIIISYSDIFYKKSAINILKNSNQDISITYDPNWRKLWEQRFNKPLNDAESFKIDAQNNVIEIGNKVNSIEEIKGQYMGLIKLTKNGWKYIQEILKEKDIQKKYIDFTSLFKLIIKDNKIKIKAYPYYELWGEVDTKKDFEYYNLD